MKEEQLDGRSLDIAAEKRRELFDLFPEIRTDGGMVDFERLKQVLGESIDSGKERYGLTWPGKSECFKTIQAPSMATLLPQPDKSVNFYTAENVIIEGDNLEVLKLLQKSYLGKIKMIYIDPPYNTGSDFIYPDDYGESLQTYLQYTGQVDAEGKKFGTNTDTGGRFHSKWLNMIYPRLYLARNLLSDDGIIFISIDDNELANILRLCDEIFGTENRIAIFTWIKKRKASNLHDEVRSITEYVVAYRRLNKVPLHLPEDEPEADKPYPFFNSGNRRSILQFPANAVEMQDREAPYEAGTYSDRKTTVRLLDDLQVANGKVTTPFRLEGEWRYSQSTLDDLLERGERIVIKGAKLKPYWINNNERAKFLRTLLSKETYAIGTNEDGNQEIATLFGKDVFPFAKPTSLVQRLIESIGDREAIVLDLFAGSGVTGEAVLRQNKSDGGSRRFMLVQLPEPTGLPEFSTIADIAEERLRRVISKLDDSDAGKLHLDANINQDGGFRVFTLSQSNVKEWDVTVVHETEAVRRQLSLSVDHLRLDRNDLDIVYEVVLKSGYPLSVHVSTDAIDGKLIYSVARGAFLICLERELTLETIRAVAAQKPERALFLDQGFVGNDQLKTNAVQTFKSLNIVFRTL